ncbi:recombinase family protein [Acetobacterium sp.]|uniref:recombinase family protein n=1 Tax=Acetobacterium sp. TaxID=1872094 RepID=UPI002F3E6C78
MAKDGTAPGGSRVGAGRKPKALTEKIKDGMSATVIELSEPSSFEGAVNDLLNKNIRVNILNIGIMDNTPSSKLIRNIFFSFAEFERDMIVERTQEGKEIAKQKEGFTEGRPKKYNSKQVDHAVELLKNNSYKEVEKLTGISKSTLIRAKKKSGCLL